MLTDFGYSVSQAPGGNEAVETCREHTPGLIFLDWNMPGMDGITCLKELRAMDMEVRPTIVLCTTENSLAKIHEALAAGADEYIMKPFDRDILHDKLEQLGLCEGDTV
jgi:two-component system chemotaxis response regulator CheY